MARARKYPQIGVSVFLFGVIEEKLCILMSLKKIGNHKGYLILPGGHLEFQEDLDDCARREVQEETGVNIWKNKLQMTAMTQDIHRSNENHYLNVFFATMLSEKQIAQVSNPEPHKHSDWQWIPGVDLASKKVKKVAPSTLEVMLNSEKFEIDGSVSLYPLRKRNA
jgi:8-oxo-dGTP diphosphatase